MAFIRYLRFSFACSQSALSLTGHLSIMSRDRAATQALFEIIKHQGGY